MLCRVNNVNLFLLPQVLSRDSVTVSVDAVVYYRVSNPTMATNNIEDYRYKNAFLVLAVTLSIKRNSRNIESAVPMKALPLLLQSLEPPPPELKQQ